jgi:hypothetical protein
VTACFWLSLRYGWFTISLPLIALFAWGFFYVGIGTLRAARAGRTPSSAQAPSLPNYQLSATEP